jgi:hypothetical protein
LNNKNRNSKIVLLAVTSMFVIMGTTTIIPMLQQQQANAASLRQHSNLLNNCYRPDLCRQSNVHQGTAGNDNQVTGFGDLSNNGNTPIANTSTGVQGPAGPKGDPGAKGDPGPAGPDRTLSTRVVSATDEAAPGRFGGAVTECASDEVVTGGGFIVSPAGIHIEYFVDRNFPSGNGWAVELFNNSTFPISVGTFAVCAKLVPPP